MKLTPVQIKALRFYSDPLRNGVPPYGVVRRDVYGKLAKLGLLTSKGLFGITDAGKIALIETDAR